MQETREINGIQLKIAAEAIQEVGGTIRLQGPKVSLSLPGRPIRYLRHGWQSWSMAAWTALEPLPTPQPRMSHSMHIDPSYAEERLPHGSWLGAVEFEDGTVLLLGALSLGTHVRLEGDRLEGWTESGAAAWLVAAGEEQAIFSQYAALLGAVLGRSPRKPAPRIWCSWYSLYGIIDEPLLNRVFDDLQAFPFDVLQVDDGWELAIGDWEPNSKFPAGMDALAAGIKSRERRAGLWLAPLIAVKSSRLFRQHPEWFLRDRQGGFVPAGFNWGEPVYALDVTHPEALDWLRGLMGQVREWGFDYLKLDFLYAAGLPGERYQNMPREAAYRMGLKTMREAMGEDAYLLACGAPILPSLGLCDALRVGMDVTGAWESHRDAVLLANPNLPGTRNALRTTLHQLWLSPLVQVDPDVAYFGSRGNSMTPEQRGMLRDLALICGFRATSDLPQWLTAPEREELRDFLEKDIKPVQTGRYSFDLDGRRVDFSDLIPLPAPARGLDAVLAPIMGWLANQPWALRAFDRLTRNSLEKMKRELIKPKGGPS